MRARGEGSLFRRADGLWVGRFTQPDGTVRQVTAKKKSEALSRWQELKKTIQDGLPVVSARLTLGEFLESWLEDYIRPKRPYNTYRGYRAAIRSHIIPALGNKPLKQLHQTHVQRFMAKMGESLAPATVSRIHAILNTALNQAMANDLVTRNVAALVRVQGRSTRKEVKPMSAEDVRRMLEAVRGDEIEPIVYLAVSTGMRFGEILGLRWEDVLLNEGRIDLRSQVQWESGKGMILTELKTVKSRRSVDVPEMVIGMLREHKDRDRDKAGILVFHRELGLPLSPTVVRNHFKRVLARAGLPSFRFHDLRHTSVSFYLAQGIPLHEVSKIVGHASIQVTSDTYGHLSPERRRVAANRMGELLERVSLS